MLLFASRLNQTEWSMLGLRLVYAWSTLGLRLVYAWSTPGLRLVNAWSMLDVDVERAC